MIILFHHQNITFTPNVTLADMRWSQQGLLSRVVDENTGP
jgi:hypothetical protein